MILFSGLALLANVSGMRLEEKLRLLGDVGVIEMVRANEPVREHDQQRCHESCSCTAPSPDLW